jgi:mono/diheme cytochrome c family protein
VSRSALVLPIFFLITPALISQQSSTAAPQKSTTSYSAIPVEAARQANPVKSGPDSLARGKKWYALDCAMCHGKDGDGKGETARDMKLQVADFTDPNTLKNRSDGEVFYVIKNGHQDMPGEGNRLKTDDYWDLVNYVRSFVKAKPAEQKAP